MAESSTVLPWIWIALGIGIGGVFGFLWGGGLRVRWSNEARTAATRASVWDKKVEHQRFGIADLKLRIRASDQDLKLLKKDHALLRDTYDRLNNELQSQWDTSVHLKTQVTDQQNKVESLREEVEEWRTTLAKLHAQLNDGELTEEQLKEELALGLVALCEHAGENMPVVQQILLDYPASERQASSEQLVGLLSAKVQLLEGQLTYWQAQTTDTAATTPTASETDAPITVRETPPPPTPLRVPRDAASAAKGS